MNTTWAKIIITLFSSIFGITLSTCTQYLNEPLTSSKRDTAQTEKNWGLMNNWNDKILLEFSQILSVYSKMLWKIQTSLVTAAASIYWWRKTRSCSGQKLLRWRFHSEQFANPPRPASPRTDRNFAPICWSKSHRFNLRYIYMNGGWTCGSCFTTCHKYQS